MQRNNKTSVFGIIITIVILIILVFVSNIKIEKFSYIGNAVSSLVVPDAKWTNRLKKAKCQEMMHFLQT